MGRRNKGDSLTTTSTHEAIEARVEGLTVVTEFLKTASANSDVTALRWMDGEDWKSMTFGERWAAVGRVAAGLKA